jgi:hypothetical protein
MPRENTEPDPNSVGTLVLDFSPQNHETYIFVALAMPGYGILLEQMNTDTCYNKHSFKHI